MKLRKRTSVIWTIPKEKLQEILDTSCSFVDVLVKLGYDGYNGNHRTLKNRVKHDNFDLTKMEINRKESEKEHLEKLRYKGLVDISDILIENSSYSRYNLKQRLIDEKLKEYKCECCGIGNEWNGKELKLQLDHINGINNDNRIENLRFICPNCHSQSDTFSGKNSSRKIQKKCEICGVPVYKTSKKCHLCNNKTKSENKTKFSIDKELLEKLIREKSIMEIGKIYGVCDNTIRKRCKRFGILIPKFPKGYWLRNNKNIITGH
jgi:Zn finger protein HypA/HybF involved in hydrogenase expression